MTDQVDNQPHRGGTAFRSSAVGHLVPLGSVELQTLLTPCQQKDMYTSTKSGACNGTSDAKRFKEGWSASSGTEQVCVR